MSLDFEATGLDFAKDTIVSFGTVPIRHGRVDLGDAGYGLVDPGHVTVSPESVTVHGLRPVDLRGAPDLDAARGALGAAIGGRFLITWAAGVEAGFLDRMFGVASGVGSAAASTCVRSRSRSTRIHPSRSPCPRSRSATVFPWRAPTTHWTTRS